MTHTIKKPSGRLGLVTTSDSLNFKAKLKQFVVQMACYGLLPLAIADWLIQSWGINHE